MREGAEGGRSGNDELGSRTATSAARTSLSAFSRRQSSLLGKRGLPLARPVPGYRPSPPLLAPDIPMPFLHRGIANFFLAAAEEVSEARETLRKTFGNSREMRRETRNEGSSWYRD